MTRTDLLASCLYAGGLLLRGANAQATTADVYLPIAGGSKSLMSEFEASVVSTEGQTTVFAMSCTDGPCNPIAGGTGTLTFTAAPDTFMYHETFQDAHTYDWQCTIKGCPSVDEVKCVQSRYHGTSTSVDIIYPTFTERMPLSLNHDVPEPTPVECPTTSAPVKTKAGTDSMDAPEETGSSGGNGDDVDEGSEDGEQDEDDGSPAFSNAPLMGLVVGAVAGAAVMVL